jgi:hypothetical protein
MNSDSLYTVNASGLFCVENSKFCKNTKDILQMAIEQHERGGGFNNLTHAIQSDLYSYAKITTIAAASFFAPGSSAILGGVTYGVFKAAEEFGDPNEYDRKILQSNSSFGGDLF